MPLCCDIVGYSKKLDFVSAFDDSCCVHGWFQFERIKRVLDAILMGHDSGDICWALKFMEEGNLAVLMLNEVGYIFVQECEVRNKVEVVFGRNFFAGRD